ncbi:MAG: rhamnulose-1-phosphate aldolase [Tannerellaceae bacterium]|nr:rhamnulose-1-phosphate aldolase [Tannerellaceae bacterium]
MTMIKDNKLIASEISHIAEVASMLWSKGWAERNGGNISVDLTDCLTPRELRTKPVKAGIVLPIPMPALEGHVFYVTGTGRRMRDVAREPWENGALIKIANDGLSYDILGINPVMPTSELASHLLIDSSLISAGRPMRVVLHTHPTDLIGLTHCKELLDSRKLSLLLWSMIPECRIIVPKGIGIVPYVAPGTIELARATITLLENHDVIIWEKHGILAVGDDIIECFDAIDTLSKAAQIYFSARAAGFEAEGMTNEQLQELALLFKLPSF